MKRRSCAVPALFKPLSTFSGAQILKREPSKALVRGTICEIHPTRSKVYGDVCASLVMLERRMSPRLTAYNCIGGADML